MSGSDKGGAARKVVSGGDPDVSHRFHSEIDLVEIIARQVSRSVDGAVEFDELMASGREGLFDAARRFEPSRGIPFRAYANFRVEGAILDAVRKSNQLSRRAHERLAMLEAASAVTQGEASAALCDRDERAWDCDPEAFLDDQLANIVTAASASAECMRYAGVQTDGADEGNPEERYGRAELLARVRDAIGDLEESEATAIRLCYFEGKTFEAMAAAMGISKPWAFRLHARAMARLTKRLRYAE